MTASLSHSQLEHLQLRLWSSSPHEGCKWHASTPTAIPGKIAPVSQAHLPTLTESWLSKRSSYSDAENDGHTIVHLPSVKGCYYTFHPPPPGKQDVPCANEFGAGAPWKSPAAQNCRPGHCGKGAGPPSLTSETADQGTPRWACAGACPTNAQQHSLGACWVEARHGKAPCSPHGWHKVGWYWEQVGGECPNI